MQIIILSGRSGSGKTVALHALEDQGFYCVDNLPISLLPELADKLANRQDLAISIDARNLSRDLLEFPEVMDTLTSRGLKPNIIYIDADEAILLKRFSETRRRHPLTQSGLSLREAIAREETLLAPVADQANLLVDTSDISPHQLREFIRRRILEKEDNQIDLMFVSFGFKYGVPKDADFVFDVRCLPNPHWEDELRPLTGLDPAIVEYLGQSQTVMEYQWQVKVFLSNWLPRFDSQDRSYLTVAIGCTGGKHRSVYMAEYMAREFASQYPGTRVFHRELGKE